MLLIRAVGARYTGAMPPHFEALDFQGDRGAQPLHCHEEVEFASVYRGRGALRCGGARVETGPGLFSVVCPQEPHAGTPLNEEFAVRVLNVSARWFAENRFDWKSLWRADAIDHDRAAIPVFQTLHQAVHQRRARLHQDELLMALCDVLSGPVSLLRSWENARIARAVTLLRARFADELSLAQLADCAGLSPFYFCRAFKKQMGVTPHAYQTSLRVARAKTLLQNGGAAREVALEVGFYDQSHLISHFQRLLGETPATVQRRAISSYTGAPASR